MARIYSKKRGKSGSTKPVKKTVPSWVRYKTKEVELLVVKLAKEGHLTSKIGLILRDSYGIPSVKAITKKSVTDILKDKKLVKQLPEDLTQVIKRTIELKKHLEENKQDMTAKRGLRLAESRMLRMIRYYKDTKKLPLEWKYDPSKVRLLIE
jgi:small subunit ribosomal protein S15